MEANRFDIKQRIFKKERVRESKNSMVIVPKNNQVNNKNQIEFIWTNTCLKTDHLVILCRVAVKEWGNTLPQTHITRAFFQEKDDGKVRFYISFQVEDSLSGDQIKHIMSTSLSILDECLEKVTKKVVGDSEFMHLFPDKENQHEKEAESKMMNKAEDELIKKLHIEIENQEKLLNQLAEQQKKQEQKQLTTIKDIKVKNDSKKEFETTKDVLAEINQLEKTVESLVNNNYSMDESIKDTEQDTNWLENRLQIQAIKTNVTQDDSQQLALLQKEVKELKKENSHYRISLVEKQSVIDQYETKNNYYRETIEKIQREKTSLLSQSQKENSAINSHLAEAEKKVRLLENKYKNHEENVELLRKKLAQTSIDCEEKTKQLSQVTIQLKDERKKYEKITAELETSQMQVNQLEQDLKMAEVTNNVLKERQEATEQVDQNTLQIEEWRETYQTLLEKYSDLEQESYNYRQEIAFLNNQITQIKHELEINASSQMTINQIDRSVNQEDDTQKIIDLEYDEDEDYYYVTYESDPYIDEVEAMELTGVLTKEKEKKEERIRDLLSAYDKGKYGEIKIDKSEYRKYVSDLKFLSYRWNQVLNRNDVDITTDFLDWCDPFIKKIGVFEEGLPVEVKKPLFTKNYVVMNESLYRILKGYSLLSIYLDNYYYRN